MGGDNWQSSKTVLIVEDDASVQHILAFTLRRAGYQVVTASTGMAGVRKAEEIKPDLILMDVMMPGIDGFEATRQIREQTGGWEIPIIFLTVMDDYHSRMTGFDLGASDFMAKPVKLEHLLAQVRYHLGNPDGDPE